MQPSRRCASRPVTLSSLAALVAVACTSKEAPSVGGAPAQGATATCGDSAQNGAETDVDCGGSACAPCAVNKGCFAATDCASGVCTNKTCVAPSCSDGVRNGDESAVDCGGGCAPCPAVVVPPADSGPTPDSGPAPTCSDGAKNGTETDTDCGGACAACVDGKACVAGGDCASGSCKGNVCAAPTCADGVKNGAETDADCGGATCPVCSTNKACVGPNDCASLVCTTSSCAAPTCTDGIKNGDELAKDCGGTCEGCAVGVVCKVPSDCATGVCAAGSCQPASCGDRIKNGSETGRDCGGGTCPACGAGEGCAGPSDCVSGVCTTGKCNDYVTAPPLTASVGATTASATRFLYSGANPVQVGVGAGTIVAEHAAALRGRVIDRNDAPVSDVRVTVVGRPEFGHTSTHADGTFDMAVNGGVAMVLDFTKTGVLGVQRTVDPAWGEYRALDDIVVTALDAKVTTVDLPAMTRRPSWRRGRP